MLLVQIWFSFDKNTVMH